MLTGATSGFFILLIMIQVVNHLEYPDHFSIELGVLKVLGSLVLLIPGVSSRIKEWAYFGFEDYFLIRHLYSLDDRWF